MENFIFCAVSCVSSKTWVSIMFQNLERLNCCQNGIFCEWGVTEAYLKHSETSLMVLLLWKYWLLAVNYFRQEASSCRCLTGFLINLWLEFKNRTNTVQDNQQKLVPIELRGKYLLQEKYKSLFIHIYCLNKDLFDIHSIFFFHLAWCCSWIDIGDGLCFWFV